MSAVVKFMKFIIVMICLAFFVFASLLSTSAYAQGESDQKVVKSWGVPNRPLNCEMNLQNLEHVRDLVKKQTNRSAVLILIARLGNGEKRDELNHRRLYNVRESLNNTLYVPREKIVIAQGEKVVGLGRVEFYLDGEMIGALLVKPNDDICVGCCGPDKRFYPYKDEFERKSKQKKQANKSLRAVHQFKQQLQPANLLAYLVNHNSESNVL